MKFFTKFLFVVYGIILVFDIQDESSRTELPRPFPFKQTVDPREYSRLLREISHLDVITYKSVAQRSKAEFDVWLDETKRDFNLKNLVALPP